MQSSVYQVTVSDGEDTLTLGVFSIRERAEALVEAIRNVGGGHAEITEHRLDSVTPPSKGCWRVVITKDGAVTYAGPEPYCDWYDTFQASIGRWNVLLEARAVVQCRAANRDEAEAIARQQLALSIELDLWSSRRWLVVDGVVTRSET
jgi:hypothetical protein